MLALNFQQTAIHAFSRLSQLLIVCSQAPKGFLGLGCGLYLPVFALDNSEKAKLPKICLSFSGNVQYKLCLSFSGNIQYKLS